MRITIPATLISWENVREYNINFQIFVETSIDFSTFLEENSIDSNKKYIKIISTTAASNHIKFKR